MPATTAAPAAPAVGPPHVGVDAPLEMGDGTRSVAARSVAARSVAAFNDDKPDGAADGAAALGGGGADATSSLDGAARSAV